MSNYLSLVKVFIRSLSMTKTDDKRKKIINKILLALVSIFVMLPFVVICCLFVMSMTNILKEYNYQTVGLEFMCILIGIFSFIFGFNVILNEFYFTGDIENILPLPVKPFQIIAAKFTAAFIGETLMQLAVIIFSVLGYFLALGLPFPYFLLGIVGMITLPIIPMIYCGIISLVLMSFTRVIKNKETIRKIGLGFIVLVLLVFVYFLGSLQNFNLDSYVESFVNGKQGFLHVMRVIFPHINLFIETITNGSIGSLLLYILVNIIYILVFLGLAELLYFKGVIGLSIKDTSKRRNNNLENIGMNSPIKAYLKKEIYTLFRTTAYFLNCILINFIWPLFIYVIYKIKFPEVGLDDIRVLISNYDSNCLTIILLFVLSVSISLPAINSIAASSFSREGKNFDFIKSIPMGYSKQVFVKLFVSILIAFLGTNIFALIFYIVIRLPFVLILTYMLISLLSIIFICSLGVLIDSISPKLVWDDELNALRENDNNFIVMGITLLIFVLFIGLGYLLYRSNCEVNIVVTFVLCLLFIFNIVLMLFNKKFTARNLITLE